MKPHPSDLLVLAGEDDLAAVPVEGSGEDELGQAKVDETLARPHIPHADIVVRPAGQENVLRGRVPHHNAHSALVEVEVDDAVSHRPGDAAVGDLPHFDRAVLRDLRSKVELANVMKVRVIGQISGKMSGHKWLQMLWK